jgi:hypothetical protein
VYRAADDRRRLATTGVGATMRLMGHRSKAPVGMLDKHIAAIDYAPGLIADLAPGRDLAGELIAERRAEALGEQRRATPQRA